MKTTKSKGAVKRPSDEIVSSLHLPVGTNMWVTSQSEIDKEQQSITSLSEFQVYYGDDEWDQFIRFAQDKEANKIILIAPDVFDVVLDDNIFNSPPITTLGKILSFLYQRHKTFGGTPTNGMNVLVDKCLADNVARLEAVVLEMAHLNRLEYDFIDWLEQHNCFVARNQNEELFA
jgi:tagaturonate reductase